MIQNLKSTRGRKPRLDLQAAWVDGYLNNRPWNWSAYVLRADKPWRVDETVFGRRRRSWRSRAEKGQRIKAPTFRSDVQPATNNDMIVNEKSVQEKTAISLEQATCTASGLKSDLGWLLVRGMSWRARKWLSAWKLVRSTSTQRISPFVGVNQYDMIW